MKWRDWDSATSRSFYSDDYLEAIIRGDLKEVQTDQQEFAVPRHARWDPLGLTAVRQASI